MYLSKLIPNNFTIFAFLWSVATISHQYYYGVIFSSNIDFLLTTLALLTIIRPSFYQLFLAQVFIQMIAIFMYLPNVYNHWFLAFFISLTIVLNYLKIIISQKTFRTSSKELYEHLAPVLRIILIIVYISAFFHKLNNDYFSIDTSCGVYMYSKLLDIYSFLPEGDLTLNLVVYLSLILEILIPLLLLYRKTRMFGIFFGLYTHLIFGFMGYINFSLIMIALMTLYLPTDYFRFGGKSLKKQNYFKVVLYMFTILVASIFIYSRISYILNDVNVLFNLGRIVQTLISIIIIFVFIHYIKLRDYEWPKNFYKINYLNALIITIIILNCFSPYLGFKTRNVFSMYSNLSTENYKTNHLLVTNGSLLGGFQNDLVTINESNIKKINKYKIMPYAQLQNYIYDAHRKGKKDISVEYIRNNKYLYFNIDEYFTGSKNSVLNFLQWKFFTFKPVLLGEKKHCSL